jgi:hypothetical protein
MLAYSYAQYELYSIRTKGWLLGWAKRDSISKWMHQGAILIHQANRNDRKASRGRVNSTWQSLKFPVHSGPLR